MNAVIVQMLREVNALPHGTARLALCQEAERAAGNDEESLFHIRMEICQCGIFAGQTQLSIVAFTWCLAFYDREMTRSAKYQRQLGPILWRYKWCIQNLPEFAGVSLDQITGMMADCRRRFDESGYGPRGYHDAVGRGSILLGDLALAQSSWEAAFAAKRDGMTDCKACEVHGQVELLAYQEKWAKCLTKAKPLINGTMHCQEVPTITWPLIALARFKAGDAVGAAEALRTGTGKADNPDYLAAVGHYIEGYALLGDFAAGVRLLELRFHWTDDCMPESPRLRFYAAGALLLKKALAQEGEFRLRLTEATLAKCGAKDGHASTLQAWLEKQARDISAQLDARNGNPFWTEHLATQLAG